MASEGSKDEIASIESASTSCLDVIEAPMIGYTISTPVKSDRGRMIWTFVGGLEKTLVRQGDGNEKYHKSESEANSRYRLRQGMHSTGMGIAFEC